MVDLATVQVARMRALLKRAGDSLLPAIAEEIEREIEREIDRQLAAGRAPDGTPWPPTQKGNRALQNARQRVRVGAVGNLIMVRLGNHRPTVLHHFGYGRGAPQRQVIPMRGEPIPATWERAIDRAVDRVARRFGFA